MREFPYRHPWLFSAIPAVLVVALAILRPHHSHHSIVTAVGIFVGIVLIMRRMLSQTPGARERRGQPRG